MSSKLLVWLDKQRHKKAFHTQFSSDVFDRTIPLTFERAVDLANKFSGFVVHKETQLIVYDGRGVRKDAPKYRSLNS